MAFRRINPLQQVALPSFFAVGPPRTGTTWLYEALKGRVNLPRYTEELRFFDRYYSKGLRWYSAQYLPITPSLPIGETCSTYFYSSRARTRIAELVNGAKIICTFRDPVDRLFSLYRAKRTGGLVASRSFREALFSDPEFLESSRYAFHLTQWQRAFGKTQVFVAIYDDLMRDPQDYLNDILDFADIPRFQLDQQRLKLVNSSKGMDAPWSFRLTRGAATIAQWLRTHRAASLVIAVKKSPLRRVLLGGGASISAPDAATVEEMRELFRPEVEQLEAMTGRDLSAWKSLSKAGRSGDPLERQV
jgi:hypothetical protein